MPNTTYGTPFVASSDLVSAYPGVSSTLATRVDDISLKGNGLNDQTGTAYTLVLTDGGKTVTLNNASAVTVTIPTNTSVAFPLGTEINFVNKGAGTVTIQPTGGVTLNGGNLTLPQFAAVQVVKLDTNTWGQLDSVGTTPGLTLVSPSSIANSGGSASASGGAVTFTTVTSLSLNGVFSSTFDNYRLVLNITSASAATEVRARYRASGTDDTSSNYHWQQVYIAGVNNTASRLNTQTGVNVCYATNLGVGGYVAADIFRPFAAAPTVSHAPSCSFDGSTPSIFQYNYTGVHNVSTSYDGITLYTVSGNITGSVRIYGYRN